MRYNKFHFECKNCGYVWSRKLPVGYEIKEDKHHHLWSHDRRKLVLTNSQRLSCPNCELPDQINIIGKDAYLKLLKEERKWQ